MTYCNALEAVAIMSFAKAILHGDQNHQDWLIEAAEMFIETGDIPEMK